MSKNVAFTICAKNYIGLAQVLEKSIKKYNPDVDFFIFVADELTVADKMLLNESNINFDNILIAKDELDISIDKWNELSFKYNLTEFCTSIKSKCFSYLFVQRGYNKAVFFDPDILIFNKLDSVYESLNSYSVILTPHLLDIVASTEKISDNDMLNTGIFNLGFIALSYNDISVKILDWWNVRLFDYCYIDYYEGYFTDQKWMNFIATYLKQDELLISNHLGMNVAPWNFEERMVLIDENNNLFISNRSGSNTTFPLIFVHYSGFDYAKLIMGDIFHTTVSELVVHNDLIPLFNEYQLELKESNFLKFLKMQYSYSTFDNELPISVIHRRFYRRFLKDKKELSNPFNTNKGSFFELLNNQNMVAKNIKHLDKSNRFNTPNIEGKIKLINFILKLVFKVIGYERYFKIIKLLKEYSKLENHVHLVDKSYSKNNIFSK